MISGIDIQRQLLERVLANLAELDRQLAAAEGMPALECGGRMVRGLARARDPDRRGIGDRSVAPEVGVGASRAFL